MVFGKSWESLARRCGNPLFPHLGQIQTNHANNLLSLPRRSQKAAQRIQ